MAANPRSAVPWTPVHEDALKGLMHLGLGKQYALDLLEHVKGTQLSDMMNEALRMHSASKKPSVIEGGPKNAVPIKHQPSPAAPSAAPVPAPSAPPPAPPAPRAVPKTAPVAPRPVAPAGQFSGAPASLQVQAGQEAEAEAARQAAIKRMSSGWANLIPPKAPIQAAAAQLAPTSEAASAKPRIRIRAAGSRIPPAPLGGQAPSTQAPSPTKEVEAPTQAPQGPSKEAPPAAEKRVWIYTDDEYEKLAPGSKFIWGPNGRKYTKPAAES